MITKSVVLPCPRARAFALFTECAGEWWPAERRHTKDAASTICIEATGRFFERAHDGTEAELGVVRLYEPPRRLVLDWYPGSGPTHPTCVDIQFEALGEETRVTITHGPGAAGADLFERNAAAYGRSWDLVLNALATRREAGFDKP